MHNCVMDPILNVPFGTNCLQGPLERIFTALKSQKLLKSIQKLVLPSNFVILTKYRVVSS